MADLEPSMGVLAGVWTKGVEFTCACGTRRMDDVASGSVVGRTDADTCGSAATGYEILCDTRAHITAGKTWRTWAVPGRRGTTSQWTHRNNRMTGPAAVGRPTEYDKIEYEQLSESRMVTRSSHRNGSDACQPGVCPPLGPLDMTRA